MDQEKIPTTGIISKSTDVISFFEKDSAFVYVFKKTEKLASALYIITNLFSDNEPLKWTLRKKASELLSFSLGYKDISESAQADFLYSMKSRTLEIVSMLEIGFRGGIISQMNYSILKQEFLNLIEVLNVSSTAQKEVVNEPINHSFFEVPKADVNSLRRHILHDSLQHQISTESEKNSGLSIKDNNQTSLQAKSEVKRTHRQDIILALVKKRKEVTIKDVAEVIKDCSEKTIQRELIAFINAGVLKRTGERRWSKYSFV